MSKHEHRAEIIELADQCVACGACLPHCPTYAASGSEAESPRGRIVLAKALASERLQPADAADSIDHCLACRACEAMCPAHVQYGRLLRDARARTRSRRPRNTFARLLHALIARPRALSFSLRMAAALRALLPALRRRLPASVVGPRPGLHATAESSRGRLLLFEGCVAQALDGAAHHAAVQVLTRLGWEVVTLGAGWCCGSLHAHEGDTSTAAKLAAATQQALAQQRVDAVILCSSGCAEALAAAVAPTPVREIMDFIAGDERLIDLPLRPATGAAVALHTPCTQRNVLRRADAARQVLQRIAGLRIDAGAPAACCGAAGSLRVQDPTRAAAFAAPVLSWFAASGCGLLASSNIGCRVHLQLELAAKGAVARTLHPIEIVAAHLS